MIDNIEQSILSIDTSKMSFKSIFQIIPRLVNRASLLNRATLNRSHHVMVQHQAPAFCATAVVDSKFKEIKLEDFHGKYVVLFFYPLDFTFVCPTEIIAFNNKIDEFKKINTEVIGISTDSHFSHLAWINTPRKEGGLGALNFPLISDYSKNISKDYGVLLEKEGFALRGLFIIDPTGTIKHMQVNDLAVGRSVDEVLRLLNAYQFVEKHGEVCPAQWSKENQDSIKPDPDGSKSYFKKHD
ncbi:hypothetical protein GJ496_006776 [Pomphorhynchus laevis]|nr:hypothetical protein GJ496_006776 [Pomphorhynchus laevis]